MDERFWKDHVFLPCDGKNNSGLSAWGIVEGNDIRIGGFGQQMEGAGGTSSPAVASDPVSHMFTIEMANTFVVKMDAVLLTGSVFRANGRHLGDRPRRRRYVVQILDAIHLLFLT